MMKLMFSFHSPHPPKELINKLYVPIEKYNSSCQKKRKKQNRPSYSNVHRKSYDSRKNILGPKRPKLDLVIKGLIMISVCAFVSAISYAHVRGHCDYREYNVTWSVLLKWQNKEFFFNIQEKATACEQATIHDEYVFHNTANRFCLKKKFIICNFSVFLRRCALCGASQEWAEPSMARHLLNLHQKVV